MTNIYNNADKEHAEKIAEKIIDIGNGIWQNSYDDEQFEKFESIQSVRNRKQWAEISHNSEDYAIFNPYIKDNYKYLTALDIYRDIVFKMNSEQDLCKISYQDVDKYIDSVKKEMLAKFKEAGLEPANYVKVINKFDDYCVDFSQICAEKINRYIYSWCLSEHSEDLAFNLMTNIFYDTKDKIELITKIVNDKTNECTELGIPENDIVNTILIKGMTSFMSICCDFIDFDTLKSSLQNITIKGKKFKNIVLDFEETLQSIYNNAQNMNIQAEKKKSDNTQFMKIVDDTTALKTFLNWYKNNKNAYPIDIDNILSEIIQKYNIQENSYLHSIMKSKLILKDFRNLNPFVICSLERKSINGTLQINEIEYSLKNGLISIDDGIRLIENCEKSTKPEVLYFEITHNDYELFQKYHNNNLIMKRNLITINLERGNITLSEAEKQYQNLKEEIIEQEEGESNDN